MEEKFFLGKTMMFSFWQLISDNDFSVILVLSLLNTFTVVDFRCWQNRTFARVTYSFPNPLTAPSFPPPSPPRGGVTISLGGRTVFCMQQLRPSPTLLGKNSLLFCFKKNWITALSFSQQLLFSFCLIFLSCVFLVCFCFCDYCQFPEIGTCVLAYR